jgi:hypothetical protein
MTETYKDGVQKNKAIHNCALMNGRHLFTRVIVVLASVLLALQL